MKNTLLILLFLFCVNGKVCGNIDNDNCTPKETIHSNNKFNSYSSEDKIYLSIITSFIPFVIFILGHYLNKLKDREKEVSELNKRYLNGLRLYLEETYWRLYEINEYISNKSNIRYSKISGISRFNDVKGKNRDWFIHDGYYIISTCYLIACLFGVIEKMREEFPYIITKEKHDTEILHKAFNISLAFLNNEGIYYVLQHNIGQIMYNKSEDKLLSYSEFTNILLDKKRSVWFEQLINFLIDVGEFKRRDNISKALDAIKSLSQYLEEQYNLGPSIPNRLEIEKDNKCKVGKKIGVI